MLWQQIIVDGIIVSVIFSAVVAFLWLKLPNAVSGMLPPEIKRVAPRRRKKEVVIVYGVFLLLYLLLLVYIIFSTRMSGVTDFWHLFWSGYIITFMVNMADFWVLDLWFRERFKTRIMIRGTEDCKAWRTREWLRTLAIPEHWIIWPLVVCPIVGLIVASINIL